jgi:hypothetical protein
VKKPAYVRCIIGTTLQTPYSVSQTGDNLSDSPTVCFNSTGNTAIQPAFLQNEDIF